MKRDVLFMSEESPERNIWTTTPCPINERQLKYWATKRQPTGVIYLVVFDTEYEAPYLMASEDVDVEIESEHLILVLEKDKVWKTLFRKEA